MTAVDIYRSRLRVAGLLVVACGLVALCIWIISAHPGTGRRAATPSSFNEFLAYCGVLLFGFAAVVLIFAFFQRGPVVSVGPKGIFDRRISTDWVPWAAIRSITPMHIKWQKHLVIDVYADADASLPWKSRARRVARLNRVLGSHGYWMSAVDLRGGFSALSEVVFSGRQKS
ncbi:STM3941 family protein [Methylobacterium sp. CM6241]